MVMMVVINNDGAGGDGGDGADNPIARGAQLAWMASVLLLYDYFNTQPANELIRMLLVLLCPPVGTSVVPPHNERRCPCRYRYRGDTKQILIPIPDKYIHIYR